MENTPSSRLQEKVCEHVLFQWSIISMNSIAFMPLTPVLKGSSFSTRQFSGKVALKRKRN